MAYIGARLRAAREARGLTQDELATKVGVVRTDISGIENDRISVGAVRLARFAEALEVSVLELQPEAQPDQRGLLLLDHLEELAENQAQMLENQKKATASLTAQLRAIQRTLQSLSEDVSNAPRRTRSEP